MVHSSWSRVYDRPQVDVSAQRWKRKNRIARFKATIARLRSQNEYLTKELQNEINFRFSALKALLETRKELAELRKEQNHD